MCESDGVSLKSNLMSKGQWESPCCFLASLSQGAEPLITWKYKQIMFSAWLIMQDVRLKLIENTHVMFVLCFFSAKRVSYVCSLCCWTPEVLFSNIVGRIFIKISHPNWRWILDKFLQLGADDLLVLIPIPLKEDALPKLPSKSHGRDVLEYFLGVRFTILRR